MAAAGPATAGIIRADFEQILDLPTAVQNPSEGARVLRANDRTITPLDELTSADQVQNPSNWNGMLNVDLDSGSLTLRHDGGFTDFQVVSIMISDIVFSDPNEFISDVKLIVGGPFYRRRREFRPVHGDAHLHQERHLPHLHRQRFQP